MFWPMPVALATRVLVGVGVAVGAAVLVGDGVSLAALAEGEMEHAPYALPTLQTLMTMTPVQGEVGVTIL
jgi:hypothetical protein